MGGREGTARKRVQPPPLCHSSACLTRTRQHVLCRPRESPCRFVVCMRVTGSSWSQRPPSGVEKDLCGDPRWQAYMDLAPRTCTPASAQFRFGHDQTPLSDGPCAQYAWAHHRVSSRLQPPCSCLLSCSCPRCVTICRDGAQMLTLLRPPRRLSLRAFRRAARPS